MMWNFEDRPQNIGRESRPVLDDWTHELLPGSSIFP